MLNRRDKRRYILILHNCKTPEEIPSLLARRNSELFGTTSTQKLSLKMIESEGNRVIIRCNLKQISDLLTTIPLTNPSMVSIGLSGTLKRLRKRHALGKD